MIEKLKTLLTQFSAARNLEKKINTKIKILRDGFQEQYGELFASHADIKNLIADQEKAIRDSGVQAYEADPEKNKTILPGLKIQEKTVIEYDLGKALEWAIANGMKDLFATVLDSKAFESYALNVKCPDFVTVKKVPVAIIASDLSAYDPKPEPSDPF